MGRYRCAEGVSWAVELHGVVVLDPRRESAIRLGYPEAALWDLVSRSESGERLTQKMGALGSLEAEAVERFVSETLRRWVEAGLLVAEEGDG